MTSVRAAAHSTYREKLLEHMLLAELMRYYWRQEGPLLEVLFPQTDNGGFDVVLVC